jgi:hypothetical protein
MASQKPQAPDIPAVVAAEQVKQAEQTVFGLAVMEPHPQYLAAVLRMPAVVVLMMLVPAALVVAVLVVHRQALMERLVPQIQAVEAVAADTVV